MLTLKSEEGEGLLDWQGAVLSKHWICVQPSRDCCRGNITTRPHWDDFWITFEGVNVHFLWHYVSHWTTLILNLFIEDEIGYICSNDCVKCNRQMNEEHSHCVTFNIYYFRCQFLSSGIRPVLGLGWTAFNFHLKLKELAPITRPLGTAWVSSRANLSSGWHITNFAQFGCALFSFPFCQLWWSFSGQKTWRTISFAQHCEIRRAIAGC